MKIFLIAGLASFCAFSQTALAATFTLGSLLSGGSLEEGDVAFSNFDFTDNTPSLAFPGDFIADPDQVDVTTSTAAGSVILRFDFAPAVIISGIDPGTDFEHVFDFFIDFDVEVTGGSSRTLTGLTLGEGDLFAEGDASAEVIFFDAETGGNRLAEIFEDTAFGSQTSDATSFDDPLSSLSLFGQIEGQTNANSSTAGLSTFALTFDLDGTPPVTPPVTPVPLPAGLPLILAGLGSLALLRLSPRA